MSSLFQENKAQQVPSKFYCALSAKEGKVVIMENPVFILGSPMPVAYEKKALDEYFDKHGYQDPYNGNAIAEDDVREYVALKVEIQNFILNNSHLWGTEIPLTTNAKI